MATEKKVDSAALLRPLEKVFYILGINIDGKNPLFGILNICLIIFVTLLYPILFGIGVYLNDNQQKQFEDLTMSVATVACSIKFLIFRGKARQMYQLKKSFQKLDKRVQDVDESEHLRKVISRNSNIFNSGFGTLYTLIVMTPIVMGIFSRKRYLFPYTIWLPFDWTTSTRNYLVANIYQCFASVFEGMQNFCNDIYSPVSFALLSGHIQLLKKRVTKIGYEQNVSDKQNLDKLTGCIKDYVEILKAYNVMQNIISMPLFIQFVSSGLIIAVQVVYFVFYVKDVPQFIFNFLQLTAIFGELFPACYYGTVVIYEFHSLPYAIFSCNWMDQQRTFRKNIPIFMELSKRVITPKAGGIFSVHVDSFFATVKMAYSILTLLMTMK